MPQSTGNSGAWRRFFDAMRACWTDSAESIADPDFKSKVLERFPDVIMLTRSRRCLVRLEAFMPGGDYCFMNELPADLLAGDNPDDPLASPLMLFEDGIELGPPHTVHAEIRGNGRGRFSHWRHTLFFSSSDNSDPRVNGRDYQVYMPVGRAGPVQRALGALSSLPDDYTPQQAYAAIERCLALLYPQAKIGEDQKSFWKDVVFTEAYRMLAGDNYRALERKYTIFNLVESLHWLSGDMAECGAYNGGTAFFMALAAERSGRSRGMHLFDSFEGLPEPGAEDGSYWHAGDLACSEEAARHNLAGFSHIEYYPGWIPSRFPDVADHRFCFVHVDVDLYWPTRDSLDFFFPRLYPGGMLVCDDYGFDSCPGARRAMDEFFADRRERVIHLPTGQGMVIKL